MTKSCIDLLKEKRTEILSEIEENVRDQCLSFEKSLKLQIERYPLNTSWSVLFRSPTFKYRVDIEPMVLKYLIIPEGFELERSNSELKRKLIARPDGSYIHEYVDICFVRVKEK